MHWAKVCSRELLRVMFGVRVNVFVNAGKGVYVCVCSDNFCLLFFLFLWISNKAIWNGVQHHKMIQEL